MFRPRSIILAALAAFPAIAHAECNAPSTDAERAQCIGQDLRGSDAAINDTYAQFRARLSPEGQSDLRQQEIAWIKARAQTCQVDMKEPDRDKWIANLLKDSSRTVCVVRFTERRVAELRQQQAASIRQEPVAPAGLPSPALPPSPAQPPPSPPAGVGQAIIGDIYEVQAQKTVSTGKWYFEVSLDSGEIAKDASAIIFIGVKGLGFSNAGTIRTIRRNNIGQPPVNVGIAVDLDNGKLYTRVNGAGQGTPGSAAGLDLKLGRPYVSELTSSVPLGSYLDRGWVGVNFGRHGFVYAVPDGYVPLDTAPPRRLMER